MPQIWLLLGLRYHPREVNRARRPRDVIANGQFILMPRASLRGGRDPRGGAARGGRGSGARAGVWCGTGGRLHFAFAERLMETRMYQGLRQLIEGWSKNVYLGGRRSFPEEPVRRALVPVMLALAFCFWLAAAGGAAVGAAGRRVPRTPRSWPTGARRPVLVPDLFGMQIPAVYGLGYPLGARGGALHRRCASTLRGGRRVEWRGRVRLRREPERSLDRTAPTNTFWRGSLRRAPCPPDPP